MWTKSLSALFVLAIVGARPAAAQWKSCEYNREHPIPATSTLEDQFKCYKDAERKVSIAGTPLRDGGVNGGGCIIAVTSDRVQVASCTGFNDRTITIPFASIKAIHEEAWEDFVTVYLRD